jgi:uncharacterized protein YjlB
MRMSLIEDARKLAEKATGWARPDRDALAGLVRKREPQLFRFEDDGVVPNHPRWPLIIYRNAVKLPKTFDPAAVFEDLFARNGWGDSWRNGVYDYLHYHSRIHEVMGVARGCAVARFGGKGQRAITIKPGDVLILPAGTGHECVSASEDFLVVGGLSADRHLRRVPHLARRVQEGDQNRPEGLSSAPRSDLRQGGWRPAAVEARTQARQKAAVILAQRHLAGSAPPKPKFKRQAPAPA